MYNTFIFDLDGTLTDSKPGIINSVCYSLEKTGFKNYDINKLDYFIGPPLLDSFKDFCGFSESEALTAVKYFREYFRDKGIFENSLYPDVKKVLLSLKESKKDVILATSKPEKFAVRILKYFDIYNIFDFVCGAALDGSMVKKEDILKFIFENRKIDKETALMVGDRSHDIIGAKLTGIDSAGALYGYGSYEELKTSGAKFFIENINDVLKFI